MTKKQFTKFDIVPVAFLPIGKDAKPLYDAIRKDEKRFSDGVFGFLNYDDERGIVGSAPLRNGQINRLMTDSGVRVVVPTDEVYRKIFPLIEGRYYTHFNALDVRDKTPSDSAKKSFWENLVNLASSSLKRDVNFPFRLQGFYVEPLKDKSAQIIPASNFRIIEDERINLKTKFDNLDDSGMVNPENNGRYNQYVNSDLSLSGVCLGSSGGMLSNDDDLASSYDYGLVVLLTALGGSQKILGERE